MMRKHHTKTCINYIRCYESQQNTVSGSCFPLKIQICRQVFVDAASQVEQIDDDLGPKENITMANIFKLSSLNL